MVWLVECYFSGKCYVEVLEFGECVMGYVFNDLFLFYIMVRVYFYNQNMKKVCEMIWQGFQFNLVDVDFFLLFVYVVFYEEKWQEVFDVVEQGLEQDVENVNLVNIWV